MNIFSCILLVYFFLSCLGISVHFSTLFFLFSICMCPASKSLLHLTPPFMVFLLFSFFFSSFLLFPHSISYSKSPFLFLIHNPIIITLPTTPQESHAPFLSLPKITISPSSSITQVVLALGDYMSVQCHACIGGTNLGEDIRKLDYGQHVVSGTPGRVFDMIRRRTLRTRSIKVCVCVCLD